MAGDAPQPVHSEFNDPMPTADDLIPTPTRWHRESGKWIRYNDPIFTNRTITCQQPPKSH
jgi:hypothetical protein